MLILREDDKSGKIGCEANRFVLCGLREKKRKEIRRMHIPIIFEDEYLLVTDKPAGVVVNRADTVAAETLQDWAEEKLQITNYKLQIGEKNDFINRAGIVHRLDKETSGLIIIAKTPEAFSSLQLQFKERKVTKKYIALVHGKVVAPQGEIKASVGRLPWNRERFGVLAGGREAVTSYKLLKSLKSSHGEPLSLLEVTPHTGRTHQIRIHLKYLGHPIVSDRFYAGRKTGREDIKFCPRLFLHAAYIKFMHPKTLKVLEFETDLSADLQKVLTGLSKNA